MPAKTQVSRAELIRQIKDSKVNKFPEKIFQYYCFRNKRHDPELMEMAWPLVLQSDRIARDFFWSYAHMSGESADALLNRIEKHCNEDVPLVAKNVEWYGWLGGVMAAAWGSVYSHMQTPFGRHVDFFLNVLRKLSDFPRAGESPAEPLLPWLNLLCGYERAKAPVRHELKIILLKHLFERSPYTGYPLHYLRRFPGKLHAEITDAIGTALNACKLEEIQSYKSGGYNLKNLHDFVTLQGLIICLVEQKSKPEAITAAVAAKNWSDEEVAVFCEACYPDLAFSLTHVRLDAEELPDWLRKNSAFPLVLKTLYRPGTSQPGQKILAGLMRRVGLLKGKTPELSIKKIPMRVKDVIPFIKNLGLANDDIFFGKGATPAAIAKAEKESGVKFPDDMKALYAAHDGVGNMEFEPLANLSKIHADFDVDITELLDEGPEDEDFRKEEIDIRTFKDHQKLVVIARDTTSDYIFLSPWHKNKDKESVVFRYYHDQSFVCKIVAPSLAFYVGRLFLLRWAEKHGVEKKLDSVIYPNFKRQIAREKKK